MVDYLYILVVKYLNLRFLTINEIKQALHGVKLYYGMILHVFTDMVSCNITFVDPTHEIEISLYERNK